MLFNYPSYPDRYTPDSNWVRVLPIHGRPIQTAELIEMQSILHENMKRGLDTLFKNGTIIEGLNISITSQSSTDTQIRVAISSGTFYVNGVIVNIPESFLTIPNTGTHTIGVKINETVITEVEDPTLRDPIKGLFVVGMPGAARLVWTPQITLNENEAFTIAKVIEGSVVKVNSSSSTYFERLLAKYTYERNGNFCVNGLGVTEVSSEAITVSDTNRYSILLESVDSNSTDAQNTLVQALEIQARLDNLNEQLGVAQRNAEQSPTTQNNLILNDILSSITETEAEYNAVARLLVVKQDKLNKSQRELESSQSLLVNKISLLINPGVAYIQGRRIELSTPVKIDIPRQLGTAQVDTAILRYGGSYSSTRRAFSGNIQTAIINDEIVSFLFQGLSYQGSLVDITVTVNLDNLTLTTISEFIDYLINEFNSVNTPQLTYSSTALVLSSQILRGILKSNVVVSRQSNNSILIQSTSVSDTANNIFLSITDSTNLTVDIDSSFLRGASRSNSLQLGFRPVKEVISLVAELEEKYLPIIRGNAAGTSDFIGDDSVIEITSVTQGSTVYVVNRDFRLINQSKIDWSINISGSIEPAPGSVYFVSFIYTQQLTETEDFVLNREGDIIEFTGTKAPGVNRNIYIDYTYYLSRSGVVTLNPEGEASYLLGESSTSPIIPTLPDNLLSIARFDIYADRTVISELNCGAISFADIRGIINEVRANTRLIETLSLQNEVYELGVNNVGSDLVGIAYDTLQDLSNSDINNQDFTASIVPVLGGISAGYQYKDVPARLALTGAITNGQLHQNVLGQSDVITIEYEERPLISQDRSTKVIEIEDVENNSRGHIYLSTNLIFRNDRSTVDTYSPCDLLSSSTSLLSRLSPSRADVGIIAQIKRKANNLFKIPAEKCTESIKTGQAISFNELEPFNILNDISSRVKGSKDVELTMLVEDLAPNSHDYKIYLSGKVIEDFTVYNGTQESLTSLFGINAKADGKIWVRFNLPEGIECGTHILEVKGEEGYARTKLSVFNNLLNNILITSNYNWDSDPTDLVTDRLPLLEYLDIDNIPTIEPTASITSPGVLPNVQYRRISFSQQYPYLFDRVNQSFDLPDYLFITSIETKFKEVPSTEINVYLREIDEFGPKRMSIAKTSNGQLEINNTSPVEWSKFTFNSIVPLPANTYAFGIDTTSSYSIYSAVLGEEDLISSNFIGDQPYLRGDLYLSGDGNSISIKKEEDLTYKINIAYFDINECIINLGKYGLDDNFQDLNAFCFNTQIVSVEGTSIIFEYSTNDTTWNEFLPNVVVCFSLKTNRFALRVRMSTSNRFRSPVFSYRNASVSMYAGNTYSTYISEASNYTGAYKNVDLYFKCIKAPNTQITVYYSTCTAEEADQYVSEWIPMSFANEELIEAGLQIYRAKYTATNSTNFDSIGRIRRIFRYKISIANNSLTNAQSPLIYDVINYVS